MRVVAGLVVVLAVAMTGCQGSESGRSNTTDGSADAGGAPAGLGLGSVEALAQPTCTPNGRTSFVYVGTGPFCVNPWPAGGDNGGETAPGVTAAEVKIVFYVPSEEMLDSASSVGGAPPANQGTKERATYEQVVHDFDEVYQYAIERSGTFQTWGRKPVYEFVTATGTDEAAQRADALEVIAKEPFMVVDAFIIGAPVFAATVAAEKVVVVSPSTNAENAAKQRPYRWSGAQDPDAAAYLTASFLGAMLSGKEARWAGDSMMTSKPRAFGAVYPGSGLDIETFKRLLDENQASALVSEVEYDNRDPATYPEVAPTLVTKLKSAGVTSVVLFAEPTMTGALMAAATDQDYKPEWIVTGFQFHDFDGFARTNDQQQMAHAFGIGVLPPAYEGSASSTGIFQWYWGKAQGNFDQATQGSMSVIYAAIMYAGPTLTAENIERGLFSVPGAGGSFDDTTNFQYGYGKSVGLPYDEYALLGTDRNLAWWNPDLNGGANAFPTLVGQGKFMYLNDAKRYGYGQFPADAAFFDEASSVSEIPLSSGFAGGLPADNPCTDCPVNGGTG